MSVCLRARAEAGKRHASAGRRIARISEIPLSFGFGAPEERKTCWRKRTAFELDAPLCCVCVCVRLAQRTAISFKSRLNSMARTQSDCQVGSFSLSNSNSQSFSKHSLSARSLSLAVSHSHSYQPADTAGRSNSSIGKVVQGGGKSGFTLKACSSLSADARTNQDHPASLTDTPLSFARTLKKCMHALSAAAAENTCIRFGTHAALP